MDALEYEKARIRMCNTMLLKEGGCAACQMYDGLKLRCRVMESVRNPADEDYCRKTVSIVEQWAKDHPAKTRQSEFLKLFPDTPKDDAGTIRVCPKQINENHDCAYSSCSKCRQVFWLAEVSK